MQLIELKTGMVVVSSVGSAGIVLIGTKDGDLIKWFKDVDKNSELNLYRKLSTINNDMSFKDGTARIIKVYNPKDIHDYITDKVLADNNLIWEEDALEVTMHDIEEKFGRRVKIKRS